MAALLRLTYGKIKTGLHTEKHPRWRSYGETVRIGLFLRSSGSVRKNGDMRFFSAEGDQEYPPLLSQYVDGAFLPKNFPYILCKWVQFPRDGLQTILVRL